MVALNKCIFLDVKTKSLCNLYYFLYAFFCMFFFLHIHFTFQFKMYSKFIAILISISSVLNEKNPLDFNKLSQRLF